MRVTIVALLCLTSASAASAECIGQLLTNDLVRRAQSAVIFRGTVTDVKAVVLNHASITRGQIVTFAVDRLWKGDVTKVFTVYNLLQLESQTFELGKRYLLHANPVGPLERELVGIGSNQQSAYATGQCPDGFFLGRESPSGYAPRPGGQ